MVLEYADDPDEKVLALRVPCSCSCSARLEVVPISTDHGSAMILLPVTRNLWGLGDLWQMWRTKQVVAEITLDDPAVVRRLIAKLEEVVPYMRDENQDGRDQVAKYDADHDVLHLFFGEMEFAWDNEVEPGVVLQEAMSDGHHAGATILGYAKHLEQAKKHLPFVDWQMVDKVVRDTVAQEGKP
jgi:hypothetical protein